MQSVNPKLILLLVVVIALAVALKLLNPNRKFSTPDFWRTATVATVQEVPEEALRPGNRNGPVLMWAAIAAKDTKILAALVERGADVNEADPVFKGTPLTGAAGYTTNPEVLGELVRLGADIDKRVHNNEDALMIAARYNTNAGIIEKLVSLGSDLSATNADGESALDVAKASENTIAEDALTKLIEQESR